MDGYPNPWFMYALMYILIDLSYMLEAHMWTTICWGQCSSCYVQYAYRVLCNTPLRVNAELTGKLTIQTEFTRVTDN